MTVFNYNKAKKLRIKENLKYISVFMSLDAFMRAILIKQKKETKAVRLKGIRQIVNVEATEQTIFF